MYFFCQGFHNVHQSWGIRVEPNRRQSGGNNERQLEPFLRHSERFQILQVRPEQTSLRLQANCYGKPT